MVKGQTRSMVELREIVGDFMQVIEADQVIFFLQPSLQLRLHNRLRDALLRQSLEAGQANMLYSDLEAVELSPFYCWRGFGGHHYALRMHGYRQYQD